MFLKLGFTGVVVAVLSLGPALADDLPLGADLPLDPQQQQTAQSSASVLDEPIKQIAKSSDGCAVLDKDFPGLRQHSMYPFFKSMSLNQIAALSKGQITTDMMAQAKTDLIALTPDSKTSAAVLAATPVSVTTVSTSAP